MSVHQPKWDKYETALLIEAYWKIKANPSQKNEIAAALSSTLRDRASFEIDDTFRNVNGMIMCLSQMNYIFSEGGAGIPHASHMFHEMAEMYLNDRNEFDKILAEAKGMNSGTSDIREQFCEWLKENAPELKSEPEDVCKLLTIVEEFCKKMGVLNAPLFETTDVDTIKRYVNIITISKLFRSQYPVQYNEIGNATNMYCSFVQNLQKLSSYAPEEESEQELKTEYISQYDSEDYDIKAVFDGRLNYSYTKPLWFKYKDQGKIRVKSWSKLYVQLMRHFAIEYPSIFVANASFLNDGGIDLVRKNESHKLRSPSKLIGDMYIEKNMPANGMMKRIIIVTHMAGLSDQEIDIHYTKKIGESRSSSRYDSSSNNGKLKPQTPEITVSLYKNQDFRFTKPLWFRYKNKDRVYVKSWSQLYTSVMKNLVEDYPDVFVADLTIIGGGMVDIAKISESSKLRSYSQLTDDLIIEINLSASAIMKRIAVAVSMVGLTDKDIDIRYTDHKSEMGRTDIETSSFDHYKADPTTAPPMIEQVSSQVNDYDDNTNLQFDIKSFETVLTQNFPDGYTLGSFVAMLKFVYAYENIYGSLPKLESDEIDGIITKCGIKHDDRIYSPQSLLSDELRDKLFSVIDEILENGDSEIYFEDLFKVFSEDFNESNMHDAEMLREYIVRMSKGKYAIYTDYLSSKKDTGMNYANNTQTSIYEPNISGRSDNLTMTLPANSVQYTNQPGEMCIANDPSYNDNKLYTQVTQEEIGLFEPVLTKYFSKGYRLKSRIDEKKFKNNFKDTYKYELTKESEDIENIILKCGIKHGDHIYTTQSMLTDELKDKLFGYIEKSFEEGVSFIYFKALFEKFSDEFLGHNMYDTEMLRDYIIRMANGKYFIYRDFFSKEKLSTVNPLKDIRDCLKEYDLLMTVEDICKILPYIPSEWIRNILSMNTEFIKNSRDEYFHVDSFSLSDKDLENISDLINDEIEAHDFISVNELYDAICSKYPSIYEQNERFSQSGWRDVLKYKLSGKFSFSGNIVSSWDKDLSMGKVFANFADEHDKFKLDELTAFAKSVNCILINFDVLYQKVARVSYDSFVKKEDVNFQIEETDKRLDLFCKGNYLALPEIKDFSYFPGASHPWTPYLLEHYLAFHSRRYKLMHIGYNLKTVVGAIVKKSKHYKNFEDLLTDILAESDITLTNDAALDYLSNKGYIARNSYRNIGNLVINAQAKRNNKGN